VEELIGFVKRNVSERSENSAASGERGAEKGAAALVPASAHSDPEREERSELKSNFRVPDHPGVKPVPLHFTVF